MLLSSDQAGMLTTKNFREGSWKNIGNLGSPAAERDFWLHGSACANCLLKCVKTGQIAAGPWRGTIAEGPGYSAGAMLGSNCEVAELDGLMKLIATPVLTPGETGTAALPHAAVFDAVAQRLRFRAAEGWRDEEGKTIP